MTPLLWIHIERVAIICLPKMSTTDICHKLKKIDPILFKVLIPQMLRKWIDYSGDAPRWKERTLERVAAGYSPGGLTTHVGILVRHISLREDSRDLSNICLG